MGAVLLKSHAPVDRWREEFVLLCQAAEIARLQREAAEDAERIAYWQGVSAPEMLAALKAWERAEQMSVGDGDDFAERRAAKQEAKVMAHQMMRAALAKAEGRTA